MRLLSGNFVDSLAVGNVVDIETVYNADLNNDGSIGHVTTPIENDGSVSLGQSTRGVYLINGATEIKLNGNALGPGSLGDWSAIHVEADGNGGYRLLWKNGGGTYSEWVLDGSGNFVDSLAVGNVVDIETVYNADLNNDGSIGHVTTPIENDGSVSLGQSTRGVYLINGATEIKLNGNALGPGSLGDWSAIHVEADGNGGYRLLWKNGGGTYSEWVLDGSGNFVDSLAVGNVVDIETVYNADLNNDGSIGHVVNNVALTAVLNQMPVPNAEMDEFKFYPNKSAVSENSDGDYVASVVPANPTEANPLLSLDLTTQTEIYVGPIATTEDDFFLI
ncbi:hypothetical protein ABLN87_11300 [Ruegeria sp. SCPT10]|uniref:hypothetical protein n=1 Tax=Ruegeria sp. SCP10 TaxID=3141377 RepID=UPI003339DB44